MRQAGILAAAGLYAIEHNIPRLAEDHANARLLAEGLNSVLGFQVDMQRVQTNIIIVDVAGTGKMPSEITGKLKENGVLAVTFGRTKLRFVTHLDVSREDCIRAVEIISGLKF
jgi:threonine aldolase